MCQKTAISSRPQWFGAVFFTTRPYTSFLAQWRVHSLIDWLPVSFIPYIQNIEHMSSEHLFYWGLNKYFSALQSTFIYHHSFFQLNWIACFGIHSIKNLRYHDPNLVKIVDITQNFRFRSGHNFAHALTAWLLYLSAYLLCIMWSI